MSCTTFNNRLEFYQRRSKSFFVDVLDSSDNKMDLTGYTPSFYAKRYPITPSSIVDISVGGTVINASNGAILFNFTPTDTSVIKGDYSYEIVIESSTYTYTPIQNTLNVIESIK